ncbi:hypothetical protein FHS29_004608 [Saccharothrix tamanrassetensis]|uniref:SEFIR domain-containing protein n=1 Tax=Saccharothrix tamanrassetensis TaxID=1051531 RepID=A0A841CLL9_9PSEU|nr:SEFIR domain-containing protein [Saccharothrix tamanrassetensis]MBB5958000.1 hypothetical protein [Saccharothrix tamanrassetensis]
MSDSEAPRVFVSYAHDSEEHKELVLRFVTFLRVEAGVDAHFDRWYEGKRQDWSLWAIDQLEKADFILVIASPAYKRRAEGAGPPHEGRGSRFEAAIIRDNLTRDLPAETARVLPVVLPGRSVDEIPVFLGAHSRTHYVVSEFTLAGMESLLVAFTGSPRYEMPQRGPYLGPISVDGTGTVLVRSLKEYVAEVNEVCAFVPPVFDQQAAAMSGLNWWKLSSRRTAGAAFEALHEAISRACRLVAELEPPSRPEDRQRVDEWREAYLRLRDATGSAAHRVREEMGAANFISYAVQYRIPSDLTVLRVSSLLDSVRRKGQLIGITNAIP